MVQDYNGFYCAMNRSLERSPADGRRQREQTVMLTHQGRAFSVSSLGGVWWQKTQREIEVCYYYAVHVDSARLCMEVSLWRGKMAPPQTRVHKRHHDFGQLRLCFRALLTLYFLKQSMAST